MNFKKVTRAITLVVLLLGAIFGIVNGIDDFNGSVNVKDALLNVFFGIVNGIDDFGVVNGIDDFNGSVNAKDALFNVLCAVTILAVIFVGLGGLCISTPIIDLQTRIFAGVAMILMVSLSPFGVDETFTILGYSLLLVAIMVATHVAIYGKGDGSAIDFASLICLMLLFLTLYNVYAPKPDPRNNDSAPLVIDVQNEDLNYHADKDFLKLSDKKVGAAVDTIQSGEELHGYDRSCIGF